MTSVPASAERHIHAVVVQLDTALQQLPTPIHAYNGTRPDADTTCVVVHGSPGEVSGNLGDRFADITVPFQVTAVGIGPEQAQTYADAARAALLTDTPPAVAGRAVWPLWQLPGGAQPVVRDDTVNPSLWIATCLFAIKSNPA
jgi:hypothetical protein